MPLKLVLLAPVVVFVLTSVLAYVPRAFAVLDQTVIDPQQPNQEQPNLDLAGIERQAEFQSTLRIDDATLQTILPLVNAHRQKMNTLVLAQAESLPGQSEKTADIGGTPEKRSVKDIRAQRKVKQQLKRAIYKLELATAKQLRPHLTLAELKRWKQNYAIRAKPDRYVSPNLNQRHVKGSTLAEQIRTEAASEAYYRNQINMRNSGD